VLKHTLLRSDTHTEQSFEAQKIVIGTTSALVSCIGDQIWVVGFDKQIHVLDGQVGTDLLADPDLTGYPDLREA
jgi:hypothetical protein